MHASRHRRSSTGQRFTRATARREPASDPADRDGTAVELTIPATPQHLRIARLMASGVGAQLGIDVDAIDDLRLVVDEACAMLLECAVAGGEQPDQLALSVRGGSGGVRIRVERPRAELVDRPSTVSEAILDAVCASWDLVGPVVTASLAYGRGDT